MGNHIVYINKITYEAINVCKALDINYTVIYHIISKYKQTAEEAILGISDKVYTDL